MKITKLGHSCYIAEPKEGIKILPDPGAFTKIPEGLSGIKAILITHEHQDHLHVETLKKILSNNPDAVILTNAAVGKHLDQVGIRYTKLEEGQRYDLFGVTIAAFGNVHAEIYPTLGPFQNTNYMIDGLCHLGDAFTYPDADVDILALPIAAPWMKTRDAVDFVKNMNKKPRVAFPIHDAQIQDWAEFMWRVPENLLKEAGVPFVKLELGRTVDL